MGSSVWSKPTEPTTTPLPVTADVVSSPQLLEQTAVPKLEMKGPHRHKLNLISSSHPRAQKAKQWLHDTGRDGLIRHNLHLCGSGGAGEAPPLPATDWTHMFRPVRDQQSHASCTGFAFSAAAEWCEAKANNGVLPADYLSPRDQYGHERDIEGDWNDDSGSAVVTGVMALVTKGICREAECQYSDDWKVLTTRPTIDAEADAKQHEDADPDAVHTAMVHNDIVTIATVLQSGPIIVGRKWWDNQMETDADGLVPQPPVGIDTDGRHCVLLVGIDLVKKLLKIRNSWDTDWGKDGYGYISFEAFVDARAEAELWIVRRLTTSAPETSLTRCASPSSEHAQDNNAAVQHALRQLTYNTDLLCSALASHCLQPFSGTLVGYQTQAQLIAKVEQIQSEIQALSAAAIVMAAA